jgi:hypothetical protein
MTVLISVVGAICVAAVVVDVLWTTVAAGAGGGPFTSRLTFFLWRVGLGMRTPHQHRILQVLGVVITLTVIFTWIVLLLAGWFLIFNAPAAVVDATTGEPADGWSRLYFTGYTMFTLGIGDYVPGASFWQVAAVVATATGLSQVTLVITYLLSVTSSVTQRRMVAAQISALGSSPTDILHRAWNGAEFDGLDTALQLLSGDVSELAQRHLAFPVLHYFHSPERQTAVAPNIAVMDELLTILEHRVAPSHRLPVLTTHQMRNTISALLTLATPMQAQLGQSSDAPSIPPCGRLQRAGVPFTDDADWHAELEELASRRQKLRDFLTMDGWEWDSVWPPAETS